jgi:hypothetical protein
MSLTLIQRLEPDRENVVNSLPVDRALIIYGALANRFETRGARRRLSAHLMKMYVEGEKDEHRPTFTTLIRKSTPETRAVICPFGHPAASAGSLAALFSLWRRERLPSLSAVVSVAASSLPFPQSAS